MDLLDRLLGHDAWTTGLLLDRCRELTDAQLDQPFPVDHVSVRETFVHLVWNMEAWGDTIADRPIPTPAERDARDQSIAGLSARLDAAAANLAATARTLRDAGRLDDIQIDEYDPPPLGRTYGGMILHVITHSMHHRAQLLWLLDQLGLRDLPEGDLLGWEQQARAAAVGG